ncbi:MAG TPA: hypothetical protein VL125_12390 [Pelobium sp.]|nr:hypothetical protein [Pelobium sp.]
MKINNRQHAINSRITILNCKLPNIHPSKIMKVKVSNGGTEIKTKDLGLKIILWKI